MNLNELFEQYRNKPCENYLAAVLKESQLLIYGVVIKVANHQQDSEDIAQEVLIKIIQNINFIPKDTNFTGWLSRVAMNAAIDHYRQKKRAKTILTKYQETEKNQPNENQDETINIIYQHLSKLDEVEQSLVINKHVHQMTLAQLSNLYKLPVSTVDFKIKNTLKILKASIEKAGFAGVALALASTLDQLKATEVSLDLLPKIKEHYPATYPNGKSEFISKKILLKVMVPIVAVLIAYFTIDYLNSTNQEMEKPPTEIAKGEKQIKAKDGTIAVIGSNKRNQANVQNETTNTVTNIAVTETNKKADFLPITKEESKAALENDFAGQLIDAETKKPIADAKLEIWDIYTYEKFDTTTDVEGKYFVPKGLDTTFFFYLKFLKEGYEVKQTFQHFENNHKIEIYMRLGASLSHKINFKQPEDGDLYLGLFIDLEKEKHLSQIQKSALQLVFRSFTYSAPRDLYTFKKIKFEMAEECLVNINAFSELVADLDSSKMLEKYFVIWTKESVKRKSMPLVNRFNLKSFHQDEFIPEITSLETGKLIINKNVKVFRFDTKEEFYVTTTNKGIFPNLSFGVLANCILTIENKDYFCGNFGFDGTNRINDEALTPFTTIEIESLIINKETANAQIIFGNCVVSKKSIFNKSTDKTGRLLIFDRFFEIILLSKDINVPYGGKIDVSNEMNKKDEIKLEVNKKYKVEVTVNSVQVEDKYLRSYIENDKLEIRFSKDGVDYTKSFDLKKIVGENIFVKFDKKLEIIESDEFKKQDTLLIINISNENTHIVFNNNRAAIFVEDKIDYQVTDNGYGVKTRNNQIRAFKPTLIRENIYKIELKPVSEIDYNLIHIDIFDIEGNELNNLVWTIRELPHRLNRYELYVHTGFEIQEFSVDDAVKQSRTVSVINNREYFIFIDAPGYVLYHEFILVKEENGRLNKKIIIQKSNTVKLKGDLNNNIYEIAKLLKLGDVIYEYNGVRINNKASFIKAQQECNQEKVTIKLIRDNKQISLTIPAYQILGLEDFYYDDKDGLLAH